MPASTHRRLRHTASAVAGARCAALDSSRPAPDDAAWLDAAEELFRAQSYVIIPGALSATEVAAINAAIDRDRVEHPFDWDGTRGGDPGALPAVVGGAPHRYQSVGILERTDAFDGTICHPSVWPLIQRLMGGDACFDEASIMVREACPDEAHAPSMTGGAPVHEQHWHRDGGAQNHAPEHPLLLRNLSLVWILDDCDDTSHAFSLVPESVERKRALMREIDNTDSVGYRFGEDGSWTEPPPPVDAVTGRKRDPIWDDLLGGKALDCMGPAGSAVLMNTGCAHAGSARPTARARRTIHHYYGHEHNPPLSFHWPVPARFWQRGIASAESQRVFSRQGPVKKIRLVGDSIRMSYEPFVMSSLRGKLGVESSAEVLPSELPARWAGNTKKTILLAFDSPCGNGDLSRQAQDTRNEKQLESSKTKCVFRAEVIPMGETQGGTSRNILEHIDEFILSHAQLDILHLNCGARKTAFL